MTLDNATLAALARWFAAENAALEASHAVIAAAVAWHLFVDDATADELHQATERFIAAVERLQRVKQQQEGGEA